MSDIQVLHNAKNNILAIGFDNDGNVVPASFSPNSTTRGTVQINADIVHTKDTYHGDDEYIKAFFVRDESDPLYGVVFNEQDEIVKTNMAMLHPAITEPFIGFEENIFQASMQHRITQAILSGIIGIDKQDFTAAHEIVAIKNMLAPLQDDKTPPVETDSLVLRSMVNVTPHTEMRVETFIWYKNADGVWWYNNILIPELVSASTSSTLTPFTMRSVSEMGVPVPPEIVGEFYLISIAQSKSQNTLVSNVNINKHIAKVKQPIKE